MQYQDCSGFHCFWTFFTAILHSEGLLRRDGNIMQNITCTVQPDCAPINGSICLNGFCKCPEDTTTTIITPTVFLNLTTRNDTSYCLPTANLTDRCSFSVQCQYDHGLCLDGRCTCEERYFELEGRCEKEEKSHLIPIIVGSAIGGTIALTLITYCWMSRNKKM